MWCATSRVVSCKPRSKRGARLFLLPSGPFAFGHHALPHANTRAAGASHALLHAHRVKTARTSPRARKHAQRHFRAVPMCVCPVLAPHGRPAPPAPATRLSHHQSQAHDHSRHDERAAVNPTDSLRLLPGACTLFQAPCPTRARRARHDAAPPREARAAARRARRPPRTRPAIRPDLLHSLLAGYAADLLDTQHTRTLAPPDHCAADCTPRQPRSTRRGARGTPRALPGGSARIAPHACALCTLCTTIHSRLTHCATARALRKQQPYNTSEHPANSPHDAACALARACTLASPWPVHSETFSTHLAAAHRSSEDVSRSMGYRPSPRLPHAFLFTAISIKRKTRCSMPNISWSC